MPRIPVTVPIGPGQQAPAEPELKELAVAESGRLAVHVAFCQELGGSGPRERFVVMAGILSWRLPPR
jgi:hypothetical protein